MILVNNDIVSQHIEDTVRKLAKMDVGPGSGEECVHIYALHMLAKELLASWRLTKQLEEKLHNEKHRM